MPLMPTPPMATRWMCRVLRNKFSRSSPPDSSAGRRVSAGCPARSSRSVAMSSAAASGRASAGRPAAIFASRTDRPAVRPRPRPGRPVAGRSSGSTTGRAGLRAVLGVAQLVVVRGVRKRHQHRRPAGGLKFRQGHGARPADHQVGSAQGAGHVVDVGHDLDPIGRYAGEGRGHLGRVRGPVWIHRSSVGPGTHDAGRFDDRRVQGARPAAAAEDQDLRPRHPGGRGRRSRPGLVARPENAARTGLPVVQAAAGSK